MTCQSLKMEAADKTFPTRLPGSLLIYPVNSLVVSRNLCPILLSNISLGFFNLSNIQEKNSAILRIPNLCLALVIVEFLAILWFLTKWNISGNHAATWWQKLAADFPSFASSFFSVGLSLQFYNHRKQIMDFLLFLLKIEKHVWYFPI